MAVDLTIIQEILDRVAREAVHNVNNLSEEALGPLAVPAVIVQIQDICNNVALDDAQKANYYQQWQAFVQDPDTARQFLKSYSQRLVSQNTTMVLANPRPDKVTVYL